ncbi:hypothetical protein ISCGN_001921 [Ixodes scapularis]
MPDEPPTKKEWVAKVREKIKTVEANRWRADMQEHSNMHLYASFKTTIAPILWCGNTLGSRLLAEAQGGALRTRLYRQKYDSNVTDTLCSACGEVEETIHHLVLECPALAPAADVSARIEQALGFTEENTYVQCSKRRLEAWWAVHC